MIGVASQKWGETPLAIVVAAPGTAPTPESLKAYCREHLAGYKVPQLYEMVDFTAAQPLGKITETPVAQAVPGPRAVLGNGLSTAELAVAG